jgi:hypothetical protein
VRVLHGPATGTASVVRVHVETTDGRTTWGTVGAHSNIIDASYEALLDAIESKLLADGVAVGRGGVATRECRLGAPDRPGRDAPLHRFRSVCMRSSRVDAGAGRADDAWRRDATRARVCVLERLYAVETAR